MKNTRAARRYAHALFEVALERDTVQAVYRELQMSLARLDALPDVLQYIGQPYIATEQKQRVVELVLADVVSRTMIDFLKLLVGKDRGDLLDVIAEQYRELWRRHEGIELAMVTSAVELLPDEIGDLARVLAVQVGKRIEIHVTVDPEVLGGLVVVIGDRVWDGSVRGALERLRRDLKARDVVGTLRAARG